jgi:hypothetical protein
MISPLLWLACYIEILIFLVKENNLMLDLVGVSIVFIDSSMVLNYQVGNFKLGVAHFTLTGVLLAVPWLVQVGFKEVGVGRAEWLVVTVLSIACIARLVARRLLLSIEAI